MRIDLYVAEVHIHMPKPPKPHPREAVTVGFHIGPIVDTVLIQPEAPFMLILTETQKATLTLDPRTAKGNPAKLDGVPQWTTSNAAVASITPSEDGLSAVVTSLTPGSTQVGVTADADLDEGETREITGTLDVDVKAGEAVTLGVTAGTPEEQ